MKSKSVFDAIKSRMSVRAFTKDWVEKDVVMNILNLSARAPSGTNTQPWKVYALEGEVLQDLCAKVCAVYDNIAVNPDLGVY